MVGEDTDSVRCQYCGAVNPPDRSFCRTCGFVLAKEPKPAKAEAAPQQKQPEGRRISGGRRTPARKGNGRYLAGVAVLLALVLLLYFLVISSGNNLKASLEYAFVEATPTSDAYVHIWGPVHNSGGSAESGVMTIRIFDVAGNTITSSFSVGPVGPHGDLQIDLSYTWPYPMIGDTLHPVTVEYSV